MSGSAAGFGTIYLVIVLFGLILAIVWIILPFAILGTKPLLRELIVQTRRTNELLEHLAGQTIKRTPPANTPTGSGPADAPGWLRN